MTMGRKIELKCLDVINKSGFCLVYPIPGRPQLPSLWQALHPRSKMRWEWNEDGDDRVAQLWRLREKLSRSGEVVYMKYIQRRATFFSKEVFSWLLNASGSTHVPLRLRSPHAKALFEALEEKSPLSTKELKKLTGLRGKDFEREFDSGMRELWDRALVVGWGEKDDGAFPSLQVGLSQYLFEEEWKMARQMAPFSGAKNLLEYFGSQSPLIQALARVRFR